jgi:hypothetical protein
MPIDFASPAPSLLITLNEDTEGLAAGLVYDLPADFAHYLIANRKATPVIDFDALADVKLSEDDLHALAGA